MVWNPFKSKKQADILPSAQQWDLAKDYRLSQDTMAAINELSQVVRNNSEVVEIYLALGSLFRSQGEIERAIQIRHNLIVRPGLDPQFKARAYFELGRDFRRAGFLDRAADSLEEARKLVGDTPTVTTELAKLAAQRGDFELAAKLHGDLGQNLVQAHYLVRQAREAYDADDDARGQKLIKSAIRAYKGSVEAWLTKLVHEFDAGNPEKFGGVLSDGLSAVTPELRFALLEGLMDHCRRKRMIVEDSDGAHCDHGEEREQGMHVCDEDLKEQLVPPLDAHQPDALLSYYGALFLLLCGYRPIARAWLERALDLAPDFWLARLELFYLSKGEQVLTPFFEEQMTFFVDRARNVKRFVCKRCGLRRNSIFFECPRCSSWHSISFQLSMTQ